MINIQTILSSFDDKETLLKWLQKVEDALKKSVLSNVEVNKIDETQITLKFNFEDSTSIVTPAINLPKGEKGEKGEKGDKGDLALGETSTTAYAGDKGAQNALNIADLQSDVNHIMTTDIIDLSLEIDKLKTGKQNKLSQTDLDNIAMINQYGEEIERLKNNKVSKVVEQNVTYATDLQGNGISLPYSKEAVKDTLVQRNASGTISAKEPIANEDVATKKYVDSNGSELIFNGNQLGSYIPTSITSVAEKVGRAKSLIITVDLSIPERPDLQIPTTFCVNKYGNNYVTSYFSSYIVSVQCIQNGNELKFDQGTKAYTYYNLLDSTKKQVTVDSLKWRKIVAIY